MSSLTRAAKPARLTVLAALAVAGMLLTGTAVAAPSGPNPYPRDAVGQQADTVLVGPKEVVVEDLPSAATTATTRAQRAAPRRLPIEVVSGSAAPAPVNAVDPAFSSETESNSPPTATTAALDGLDNLDNGSITGTIVRPPDPQLAVGPDHIFEMVNIVGMIRSRSGDTLQTFSLAGFFGVPEDFRDTDPKVIYDAISDRWFASYVAFRDRPGPRNDEGRLYLAVSQTSDPTGAWNVYFLAYPEQFPDYAGIGVTDDKFTASSNVFDIDQPFYYGADIVVFEKAHLLAGLPDASVARTIIGPNLDYFTVRPAHSLTSVSDQYLVARDRNSATTLNVIRVAGTPANGNVTEAAVTDLTIASQTAPPSSSTAGGVTIDSGDQRILDAAWRDGSLWASASAACVPPGDSTTRSCAHLIEVDTTSTPAIAQDIMFGAVGEYYSWPAVRTDASGNVHVSLTHTNSSIFPEARAVGRLVSEPLNTMSGSTLLKTGEAVHDSDRWGDYLAVAIDPSFPECAWHVGQYAKDITFSSETINDEQWNWGTHIAVTSYSGGCDSDNDGWTDAAEAFIGTSPILACGTDAFPPDIDSNGVVQIDDVAFVAGRFGSQEGDPAYTPRAELASQNGVIQIDDVTAAASAFGQSC